MKAISFYFILVVNGKINNKILLTNSQSQFQTSIKIKFATFERLYTPSLPIEICQ